MTTSTLARRLAGFAVAQRRGVPTEVSISVRQRVLDTLGISVAATELPTSRAVLDHVAETGGAAQASAIGIGERVPVAQAALVGGVLAHSLDYDDTHLPSVLHPSASVVPAALAVADHTGASGAEVVAAIAAGLEVCVRLGMAGYDAEAGNSVYFEHGQHATSICGTIGAAVTASILYGLDADGVGHAIGIAASLAGGVLESNRTGGTVKRLHCGFAARAGVNAADLARRGITGAPTVLEGRFGFFQAYLRGQFDAAAVTDGLGEDWAVPGIFFKPYPANHFTHTAADAALALRAEGLHPSEVESITLGVATPTVRTIGEPVEVKRAPRTGYEAQFSGPYVVAAALHGGSGLGLGLDDFTDALANDLARRSLMSRISVVPDARCDAIYPHQFPAVLSVKTVDGRTMVKQVMHNRGGPDRPLSDSELVTKFRDNALRALSPAAVDQVVERAARLDRLPDVSALLAPLRELSARTGLDGTAALRPPRLSRPT